MNSHYTDNVGCFFITALFLSLAAFVSQGQEHAQVIQEAPGLFLYGWQPNRHSVLTSRKVFLLFLKTQRLLLLIVIAGKLEEARVIIEYSPCLRILVSGQQF